MIRKYSKPQYFWNKYDFTFDQKFIELMIDFLGFEFKRFDCISEL